MALMTVGVGVFGVLASYLADLFLPRPPDADKAARLEGSGDLAEIKAELAVLNARLDTIQAMLTDKQD